MAATIANSANPPGQVNPDGCLQCGKRVYPMEEMVIDNGKFHKNCFRCSHCKRVLSLSNFTANEGVLFCKPHFVEKFKSKGNYEEGFGKKRHSMRWGAEGKIPENGVVIPDVVPVRKVVPSNPSIPEGRETTRSDEALLHESSKADEHSDSDVHEHDDDVDELSENVSAINVDSDNTKEHESDDVVQNAIESSNHSDDVDNSDNVDDSDSEKGSQ